MKAILIKTQGVENVLIFENSDESCKRFNKICWGYRFVLIDDDFQFEQCKDDVGLTSVEEFTLKYKGPGLYNYYTLEKSEDGLKVVDKDDGTIFELVDFTEIEKANRPFIKAKFDFTKIIY